MHVGLGWIRVEVKGTPSLTLVIWSPSRQRQKPEQRVSPRLYLGVSGCVGNVTDLSAMT